MATPLSLPGQDDDNGTTPQGQGSTNNLNAPPPANSSQTGTSGLGNPPPSTGGGAGVSSGKGTSSSPNFSNNFKPTSSGSFTNLNNYLNANQGWNSGGGGLAGQVVSNINNQADTTQGDIANAQNSFTNQNQQAQNAYSGYGPDSSGSYGAATTAATNAVNNAVGNTTGPENQNDISNISTLANANYNGPQGLESVTGNNNLTNLQSQATNLSNEAGQAQTEGGRYNLLNQMFGKSGYTGGQQTLDNALMESNPSQISQLNGAQRIANNVTSNLNNNETQDQATAQSSKTNDVALAAATNAALNSAANTYLSGLPGVGGDVSAFQGQYGSNANPYNILSSGQYQGLNNLNSLLGGTTTTATAGIPSTQVLGALANPTVSAALSPYLNAANQAQAGTFGYNRAPTNIGINPTTTTPVSPTGGNSLGRGIGRMAPQAPGGAQGAPVPVSTPAATPDIPIGPNGQVLYGEGGVYSNGTPWTPTYYKGGMVFPGLKKYIDRKN